MRKSNSRIKPIRTHMQIKQRAGLTVGWVRSQRHGRSYTKYVVHSLKRKKNEEYWCESTMIWNLWNSDSLLNSGERIRFPMRITSKTALQCVVKTTSHWQKHDSLWDFYSLFSLYSAAIFSPSIYSAKAQRQRQQKLMSFHFLDILPCFGRPSNMKKGGWGHRNKSLRLFKCVIRSSR